MSEIQSHDSQNCQIGFGVIGNGGLTEPFNESFERHVLYKGQKNLVVPSYAHVLSFTTICKGHTIVTGPARASR